MSTLLSELLEDFCRKFLRNIIYILMTVLAAYITAAMLGQFTTYIDRYQLVKKYIDRECLYSYHQYINLRKQEKSVNQKMLYMELTEIMKELDAGSYILTGNSGYVTEDFDTVVIVYGDYFEELPAPEDGCVCYFPEGTLHCQNKILKSSITVAEQPYYPADMSIYSPMYYVSARELDIQKPVFIVSKDLELLQRLFPWEDIPNSMFEHMLLDGDDEQMIQRMQKIILDLTGDYITFMPVDEIPVERTGVTLNKLLLYIEVFALAFGFFLLLLLLSFLLTIRSRMREFAVIYLYGCSTEHLTFRLLLYVLLLHVPAQIVFLRVAYGMNYDQLSSLPIIIVISVSLLLVAGTLRIIWKNISISALLEVIAE